MAQDGGSVLCLRWDALQEEFGPDLYLCHALSFVTALILPVAKCSKNKLRLDCGQSWVRKLREKAVAGQ